MYLENVSMGMYTYCMTGKQRRYISTIHRKRRKGECNKNRVKSYISQLCGRFVKFFLEKEKKGKEAE
jgi:hypothetical protein